MTGSVSVTDGEGERRGDETEMGLIVIGEERKKGAEENEKCVAVALSYVRMKQRDD